MRPSPAGRAGRRAGGCSPSGTSFPRSPRRARSWPAARGCSTGQRSSPRPAARPPGCGRPRPGFSGSGRRSADKEPSATARRCRSRRVPPSVQTRRAGPRRATGGRPPRATPGYPTAPLPPRSCTASRSATPLPQPRCASAAASVRGTDKAVPAARGQSTGRRCCRCWPWRWHRRTTPRRWKEWRRAAASPSPSARSAHGRGPAWRRNASPKIA